MLDCYAKLPVFRGVYEWVYSALNEDFLLQEVEEVWEECVYYGDIKFMEDHEELFRFYNPFQDEPALFRHFADLEPLVAVGKKATEQQIEEAKQAILAFISCYGALSLLGLPESAQKTALDRWIDNAFNVYRYCVPAMGSAIRLWEAIRTNDQAALRQYVEWHGERGRPGYWACCDTHIPTALRSGEDVPEHWRGIPYRASDGLYHAKELLNTMVSKATSDAHLAFWQPPRGPLAVRIEAPDMWTAMWLQFALAVIEEKEYRRCEHCGKPFELGHKRKGRQSRADKEFCNVTCRVKFYQRRQAKARKMRAEGAKLQAIVKAVGADLKTVKRWVAE